MSESLLGSNFLYRVNASETSVNRTIDVEDENEADKTEENKEMTTNNEENGQERQDSQHGAAEDAGSRFTSRLKNVGWQMMRMISFLKPKLPFTYMGPNRFFFNRKIVLTSSLIVVALGGYAFNLFYTYGSIRLMSEYS